MKAKFICKADSPEWHSHRQKVVTGSDVAVLLGHARWGTREDLLEEKRGGGGKKKDNLPMWFGRNAERHNVELFKKATKIPCRSANLFYANSVLGATIDGFVKNSNKLYDGDYPDTDWVRGLRGAIPEGLGLLEMKQVETFVFKKMWGNGVPAYVNAQVQTQLLLTERKWAMVVARVGTCKLDAFVIEADPFLQEEIQETAAEFMREVHGT